MLRELPLSYADLEDQRNDLELWLAVHDCTQSCPCFEPETETEADDEEF